jgi:hypothetical protein
MSKKTTPILDGAYEVVGIVPGPIGSGAFGIVDLSKIPAKKAEQLVKSGCPYLRKVEKKTTKADKE